jgi:signal transduction histidine kinase
MQVIEDTGLLLSHRLRLSQCSLIVSSTAANPTLYGDPGKLGQVLTNLIVNAIDAYHGTNSAGGEIIVQVSEAGGALEVRVRDYGSGIPADHLERIFEEFFSTKPLGEGTGLGLPLARSIVTNFFGGTISVHSELGHGSEFLLQLPRLNPTEAEQRTERLQTETIAGNPVRVGETPST